MGRGFYKKIYTPVVFVRSELSLSGGELEELKVRFQKTVKQEREEKSRKEKEINLLKDRLNKLEIR